MVLADETVRWMHNIVYANLEKAIDELVDCRFEDVERRLKRTLRYVATLQLHETVEDPEIEFNELRKEGKHESSD